MKRLSEIRPEQIDNRNIGESLFKVIIPAYNAMQDVVTKLQDEVARLKKASAEAPAKPDEKPKAKPLAAVLDDKIAALLEEAGLDPKSASDEELLAVKGIGPKALKEIRQATA